MPQLNGTELRELFQEASAAGLGTIGQGGYPAYGNSRKKWDSGTRWNFENPEYR